jgi:flagellar basal body-associated protein FliL
MASNDEAERRRRRPGLILVIALVILILVIVASAFALTTVSKTTQLPPSDFAPLPTTPLSTNGTSVVFTSIGPITKKGVSVGLQGYLQTGTGQGIAGANVYAHYYYQGDYRTQVATTDQNGYFQIIFPMNWTGWLPVTLTYFGDTQHQGQTAVYSVQGESL